MRSEQRLHSVSSKTPVAYILYMNERTLCYISSMEVSITQFRRDIFSLVNQALDGGEVWFTHKGRRQ